MVDGQESRNAYLGNHKNVGTGYGIESVKDSNILCM